jgi:hypothetical protein
MPYRPLGPHMLPAWVQFVVMNAYKGTKKLRPIHPVQELEFKHEHNWKIDKPNLCR